MLPLAAQYDADFVGLLWGPEGMPRDENERGALCAELVFRATGEFGIAPERILIDPIQTPVNVQQGQIMSVLEFMKMLADIAPGCRSTIGLSNVSNGPPEHLRPILNQVMLIIWKRHGLYSCIVDTFDTPLHEIALGKRPDLEALVHKVEDGERIDMSSLSKEEADYVKTAKVILGHALFSDSWLGIVAPSLPPFQIRIQSRAGTGKSRYGEIARAGFCRQLTGTRPTLPHGSISWTTCL